jgi:hypothetical protein
MKKILIGFLLLVYTTFASGINLQLHYCQGKLKSISFFAKENSCCTSKSKKSSCCDNKTNFFKVNDKHSSNASLTVVPCKGKISQVLFSSQDFKLYTSIQGNYITAYHAPPVIYDNPLYLKNRVLII